MTNLINKSSHPVEVKKVRVKIWTLRDEIETAITNRIKEDGGDLENVFIDDIKEYYHSLLTPRDDSEIDSEDEEENDDNLDASGNPMDDDAAMMMAAMGDDKEAPVGEEAKTAEEDDEAARLAAEMLRDQAVDAPATDESPKEQAPEVSAEDADYAAAKMAAEMLADQGGTPTAATETNTPKNPEPAPRRPFGRVMPPSDKVISGEVLLSDIQMSQILMFTNGEFVRGQNVIIQFLVTRPFTVSGEIFTVQNYGRNSKIIKENKLGYRIQSVFSFQFPEERNNLRNFLSSVEPTIPPQPKKVKRDDDEGDDDDFDDLGF